MKKSVRAVLAFIAIAVMCPVSAELPGDSVYQIDSTWKTQQAEDFTLEALVGKKVVMSMAYTSCPHTCPTIVSNMQTIESSLSEEERQQVTFLFVSLQPEFDTPEVLRQYAEKRNLQDWVLLSGSAQSVRLLSMALRVKYADVPDGEIAHSNLITVLDEQGRVQRRIEGLAMPSDVKI